MQVGLPFLGSRYSRVFASYGIQRIRYDQGSADLQARFRCSPCTRSTLGLTFLRDTRVGLPFPVAGSMVSVGAEQNGGFLGGDGNYQKIDLDTRWFAPLGALGGPTRQASAAASSSPWASPPSRASSSGTRPRSSPSSIRWAASSTAFRCAATRSSRSRPTGTTPSASGSLASPDAFGKAYAAFTVEAGRENSPVARTSTSSVTPATCTEMSRVRPDPPVPGRGCGRRA